MFFRNKRQVIKDVVSTLQTVEDRRNNTTTTTTTITTTNNNNSIKKTTKTTKSKKSKKKCKISEDDIFKRQHPYNPYYFPGSGSNSSASNSPTTTSSGRNTSTPSNRTTPTTRTENSRRTDQSLTGVFHCRRWISKNLLTKYRVSHNKKNWYLNNSKSIVLVQYPFFLKFILFLYPYEVTLKTNFKDVKKIFIIFIILFMIVCFFIRHFFILQMNVHIIILSELYIIFKEIEWKKRSIFIFVYESLPRIASSFLKKFIYLTNEGPILLVKHLAKKTMELRN